MLSVYAVDAMGMSYCSSKEKAPTVETRMQICMYMDSCYGVYHFLLCECACAFLLVSNFCNSFTFTEIEEHCNGEQAWNTAVFSHQA